MSAFFHELADSRVINSRLLLTRNRKQAYFEASVDPLKEFTYGHFATILGLSHTKSISFEEIKNYGIAGVNWSIIPQKRLPTYIFTKLRDFESISSTSFASCDQSRQLDVGYFPKSSFIRSLLGIQFF